MTDVRGQGPHPTRSLGMIADSLVVLTAVGNRSHLAQSVADLITASAALACQVDLNEWGSPRTMARSVASGHEELVPAVARDLVERALTTGTTQVAAPGGSIGWAVVPLVVDRRTIGTLSVGMTVPDSPFPRPELEELERIASVMAAGLVRAEAHERAVSVSRSLQESLVPAALPAAAWFTIAGSYRPATAGLNVGGDWYDAELLANGELAISVGDVAGHGVEAAARMGEVRSAMTALRLLSRTPDDLLSLLHRVTEPAGYFATTICGRMDRHGEFRWSSAGHLPPVLVRSGSTATLLSGGQSPPLGTGFQGSVSLRRCQLSPGDAVVMYTDGLVERRDEPLDVSLSRLVAQLSRTIATEPDDIIGAITRARESAGPTDDDIAVVLARFNGSG